jgi:hypothetical protein
MEEREACKPVPLFQQGFNRKVVLPCRLTTTHIQGAMGDFLDFLGFLNQQLSTRELPRMESAPPFLGASSAFPVGTARDRRPSKTRGQPAKTQAGHKPAAGSWPAQCSTPAAPFSKLLAAAEPSSSPARRRADTPDAPGSS